jgi:hypothetical protein
VSRSPAIGVLSREALNRHGPEFIVCRSESDANSVLYLHTLARGNQIANPAQALETTYVRISERGRENE